HTSPRPSPRRWCVTPLTRPPMSAAFTAWQIALDAPVPVHPGGRGAEPGDALRPAPRQVHGRPPLVLLGQGATAECRPPRRSGRVRERNRRRDGPTGKGRAAWGRPTTPS